MTADGGLTDIDREFLIKLRDLLKEYRAAIVSEKNSFVDVMINDELKIYELNCLNAGKIDQILSEGL